MNTVNFPATPRNNYRLLFSVFYVCLDIDSRAHQDTVGVGVG